MTFFGIAESSGTVPPPSGVDPFGRKIYARPQPRNFTLVVEAGRAPNGADVGTSVFDPFGRPDLQIQANRPLGNGSRAVCDQQAPDLGGVPAIDPPNYDPDSQVISDALNDFACRFRAHARTSEGPCTLDALGNERFLDNRTTVQFCFEPPVGLETAFPPGDTVLTVRVRDVHGVLGDPVQIVVRVP